MSSLGKFAEKFEYFATAGKKGKYRSEDTKSIFLTTIFSLIAIFILLFFALHSILISHKLIHGFFLFCFIPLLFGNYLYLRCTGNYRIPMYVIMGFMGTINIYLFCTGGVEQTGPFWFFVFPPLSFYVLGVRYGTAAAVLLMIISLSIYWIPGISLVETEYSMIYLLRLTGVYFAVTFMSFVYEFTRSRASEELHELSRKLDECSRTDELTGLSNRRDMRERLETEINRKRRNRLAFSIILCDIDYFKNINDTYGHECGDQILKMISDLFRSLLRFQDSVSRWGGEEFLILLPETSESESRKIAERLRRAIEMTTVPYKGIDVKTTMSFGVCTPENDDMDHFIRQADDLLYLAKNQGRNRVCW